VAHVLEGSVRKAGNTIRVTAQLIRADNGYHLWSETYDRDFEDVFKVQDEIAGAVVSALKLKLVPGQQANSHRTSNSEAYTQYLLGRQFYERRTLRDTRRAVDAYRKAIGLDPRYAAAYSELAVSEYAVADDIGDATGRQQALASAEKAVALAPDEPDGYVARGYMRSVLSWDWIGAEADYAKALTLNPDDNKVQRRYGILLGKLGRLPEAITALKKATELDPLSSFTWTALANALTANDQFDAAQAAFLRALEIQPDNANTLDNFGWFQLLQGKAAEGLATFSQESGQDSPVGLAEVGIAAAQHTLGHAKESQRTLDGVIAHHAQDGAYGIASVYAWRGENDKAFEWLDRAYQHREEDLTFVKIDRVLASLHSDPRFGAMLRKMNLPD
jgi:Tfp pilus assembly protein PilF